MSLKAISLYTGMGGLDYGFEAAGFETAVAVELDPIACRTIRLNRSWPVLEGDIETFSSAEILAAAGLGVGEADILIGGPPCQPFSKSGYWVSGDNKRLNDPRASTLTEYFRVLSDTQPRVFLLENVLGLGYSGKSEGLELVRRRVEEINAKTGTRYSLKIQAVNAADYGVPQLRERLLIVGVRDGTDFRFPEPTHGPADRHDLSPYLTAWDALGDLPQDLDDPELKMTGKWADLMPSIPEGQNYLWHTARGGGLALFGWRTRFWNFLLKLAKDKPAWTIQAQPGPATGPFHWNNRKLSAAELGRLQTFPDGLKFDCTRRDIQRLAGNAVPSALAEVVARAIITQCFAHVPLSPDAALIPRRRADRPVPAALRNLPKKYRALIGAHPDHPGTGKGRRAVLRIAEAA